MLANTHATITLFNGGQILLDPRRLNPLHLSIAQRAYAVQSKTFGIPDRWGMFSPGPPGLQVWEAARFVYAALAWSCLTVWALVASTWHWWMGLQNPAGVGLFYAGLVVGMAVFLWVVGCARGGKRAPGYIWKDWEEGDGDREIGEVEQDMRGVVKNFVLGMLAYTVVEGLRLWAERNGGLLVRTAMR